MTATQPAPYFARRGSGPVHIIPGDGLGVTLCGTRVLQYLATRTFTTRPPHVIGGWCAACLRHEAAGTRKARKGSR